MMTKSLPVALLTAAALLSGTAAFATTTPAKPAAKPMVAQPMPAAKASMTKTVASKTTTKTTTGTTTAAKGRMVTAKLSNGKTVTYNCALAGNATKTACKS